jgi:hypothetical protein
MTGDTLVYVVAADPQGLRSTRTFNVSVNARNASMVSTLVDTYGKAEDADATVVNGYTFDVAAEDGATFDALVGPEEP